MNFANSTMRKNFVPIVDFCQSPWAFVRLLLFVSIAGISYESIMDSLEILHLALLLQLVSIMVCLVSRLFTISMSVGSSFLDYVLKN